MTSPHPPLVISIKHNTEPWIVFHAQSDAHAKDLLGASFSDADAVFRDGGDLVRGVLAAQNQYRTRADKAVQYYAERALHNAGAVQSNNAGGYEAVDGGFSDGTPLPEEPQGYQGRYDNQSGGGYQQAPAQQNVPAQRSYGNGAAAPSNEKTCKHGVMKHNSGEKNGKPWEGWFCPADRNAPDKCDPVWPKRSFGR